MFNERKLKQIEAQFLAQYPLGFEEPELVQVGKKHRMEKMVALCSDCFRKAAFSDIQATADNMVKVVSRSSMVSMFEKPKFRDFVKTLDENEKVFLVQALKQLLHGKKQTGFEAMVDILKIGKLAKWSLVSIIPAYYSPQEEVFIKPTTTKNVLRYFEMEQPVYKPTPTWEFYSQYRELINNAKSRMHPSLSPSNAAFCGMLMMATK